MPQEFQVVRCFSCETFNVDIVKKDNSKWQCKLCGEKQSRSASPTHVHELPKRDGKK